jgi:hypothetical protein
MVLAGCPAHPIRGSVPKEIDFSSYECDCGHRSHFFENTIREAKAMSHRRRVRLLDSEAEEHTIVFEHGKMVDILCPKTDSARRFQRKRAGGASRAGGIS